MLQNMGSIGNTSDQPNQQKLYTSLSLVNWNSCIASMLNIGGWSYLPGAEASGALVTVLIGLRATICLIRHISIIFFLVLLLISVSLPPSFPILLSLSL